VESFRLGREDAGPRSGDKEVHVYEALGYAHARLAAGAARVVAVMRGERGQGTVEYVALVMLVALVMFGVVTAMKTYKFAEGQQLGDLIVKKIRDAVAKVKY
jgi:hypothetical protein